MATKIKAIKSVGISQKDTLQSAQLNQGASAQHNKVARMGTNSIPRLILEFAVPSILGMLVNGAYNVIDSVFLGRAMGEIGLSAATVASPVMIVFIAIALLIGNGGNALAALRLGEGRHEDAEISLGNTMFLSVIVAVVIGLAAMNHTIIQGILSLSSATDDVRPYAQSFLSIICYGFIFQCVGMGVNNFIRTTGAPNRALLTMLIGLIVSTAFNYLFVILWGWGVEGSALATIIGQAASCFSVLWYFTITKNVALRLHLRRMRPHLHVLGTIVALGFASFSVQAGMAVASFVINHLLVIYGATSPIGADDALASIGVVQRIAMFATLPLVGVAIAIQPLIGYNYGAKYIDRVRKTLFFGIAGATGLSTFMWLIIHIFPEAIVGAFGITHAGLVDFTVFALKVQLLMLPFVGMQIVGSNYFQATGQPLKSITLALCRQIIFLLPLLFVMPHILPLVLPQFTSLDALYFAAPISDFLTIFATLILLAIELKRLRKVQSGQIATRF